jgi:hypothetical protein
VKSSATARRGPIVPPWQPRQPDAAGTHAPGATHFSSVRHAVPHAPQFAGSVEVSMHVPPQSASGGRQVLVATHAPAVQTWAAVHATPHAPQFASSLEVSTHVVPQAARGAVQAVTHAPAVQTSFAAQETPHAPQFASSVCVSAHADPQ